MITLQESPGFFIHTKLSNSDGKDEGVDRGGEDLEDSPPRVRQDEENIH